MGERKRRVRTGCLTCRQRRVKCDERKPFCERCEAANISCSGYEQPRQIGIKNGSPSDKFTKAIDTKAIEKPPPRQSKPRDSPLVAYPSNATTDLQRPHQRARELLAHQQYASKTVKLLFRDEHLYFWRDHLLALACEIEYLYDAVVALGTMHSAALLLMNQHDKWRGLDTKVVAFQAYGNTLKQLSEHYKAYNRDNMEALIAVLLLLTYFECFTGNSTAAFRHFCAARRHLSSSESSSFTHMEPLVACANELALTAQIVLPLANFRLNVDTNTSTLNPILGESSGSPKELQQLLSFISSHYKVNTAVWSPWSHTDYNLDSQVLGVFQADLLRWRAASMHTFQGCDGMPNALEMDWASLQELPIPPKPLVMPCMSAALAGNLFHCYMGRTMWMMSMAGEGDESYEVAAYVYAYRSLRIIEGIWRDRDERVLGERDYLPCNALKIGLTPLLYLIAQFCYNASWRQWIISKLHSIGQEGLYNGEAFAASLESLGLFEAHAERIAASPSQNEPNSPCNPLHSRIVPVTIPSTDGKIFATYYVRAMDRKARGTVVPTQIVGRARWTKNWENGSRNHSLEFFDTTHPINENPSGICVYRRLALSEPIARDWETLLSSQAVGPDAYYADPAFLMVIDEESTGVTSGFAAPS